MDARQQQALQERRAGMSIEERQIEAIETIADALRDIRTQLVSANHHLGAISRRK